MAEAGGKKVIDMWDRLDELWKRNDGPEAADAAAKKAQELARRGATKARARKLCGMTDSKSHYSTPQQVSVASRSDWLRGAGRDRGRCGS